MQPLLLDTCALIWVAEDAPISPEASERLDAAASAGAATFVSPITAWEVGLLAARERLKLLITPERWFGRILDIPTMRLAPMTPDLLIQSSYLPGTPPRDPADRIIAATVRELGCTLITRDRVLLDYAAQGHIGALAC